MAIEIEVFDAQIDALLNPHARPVEQHDHTPHRARELLQQRPNLLAAQQRAERLILRGCTDAALDRQPSRPSASNLRRTSSCRQSRWAPSSSPATALIDPAAAAVGV